jgi:hypothetical protein
MQSAHASVCAKEATSVPNQNGSKSAFSAGTHLTYRIFGGTGTIHLTWKDDVKMWRSAHNIGTIVTALLVSRPRLRAGESFVMRPFIERKRTRRAL